MPLPPGPGKQGRPNNVVEDDLRGWYDSQGCRRLGEVEETVQESRSRAPRRRNRWHDDDGKKYKYSVGTNYISKNTRF